MGYILTGCKMKNLDLVKIPNQKELLNKKQKTKKLLVPKIDYGYRDQNTKSTVIFSLYPIRTRAGRTYHIRLQLRVESELGWHWSLWQGCTVRTSSSLCVRESLSFCTTYVYGWDINLHWQCRTWHCIASQCLCVFPLSHCH